MDGLNFDWSVRVGDIMIAGGMMFGFVSSTLAMRGELKQVQGELTELRKVVINQARADERLNAHEKRLEALEK